MNKVIYNSLVEGKVKAPPSKSFMLRAVALSVLSKGTTFIENPSECQDALTVLDIARSFNCEISYFSNGISIESSKLKPPNEINCKESGLAMRLFTAISALFAQNIKLNAEGSLLKRPSDFMISTLNKLGVELTTTNGQPPIYISSKLKSGITELDGSISSQFLSGLLIALPLTNGESTINCINLKSSPYIDMTIDAIKYFGAKITQLKPNLFHIKGNQNYNCNKYIVEGDWSGAAGLLVAGAISGKVTVSGLNLKSKQADIAILKAIKDTGALIEINEDCVSVKKVDVLKPFEFNALHCPDLFPVLTALAANCNGISKISGLHRLIHKESNRALVLKQEFSKIGVNIGFEEDIMIIKGENIIGGEAYAHNDHRIAFSLTLAALNSENPINIEGADCVNKTYPKFFKDMEKIGTKIK